MCLLCSSRCYSQNWCWYWCWYRCWYRCSQLLVAAGTGAGRLDGLIVSLHQASCLDTYVCLTQLGCTSTLSFTILSPSYIGLSLFILPLTGFSVQRKSNHQDKNPEKCSIAMCGWSATERGWDRTGMEKDCRSLECTRIQATLHSRSAKTPGRT
jgi:hypothetical protein